MMAIERDEIELCTECMIVAVNGDYQAIDEYHGRGEHPGRGELRDGAKERAAVIDAGLAKLGPNLVPSFDSETGKGIEEFSTWPCECCGSALAGSRHQFATLGEACRSHPDQKATPNNCELCSCDRQDDAEREWSEHHEREASRDPSTGNYPDE